MSSDETAIRVDRLSKCYRIYDRPQDRLRQAIVPRLQRLFRTPPQRYFREFWALREVSFEVKRGETVGIIGRNGSGKSTLLQIISGTLAPTNGTVNVTGRVAALLELGAGFNPEFTGRENVYMNGTLLGMSTQDLKDRFDDIAAFADIGGFMDQPVKTYSSGMFVRLAFATAINVDPDILIVDEALAVGDEAFQRKCFTRIEKIQDRGGTVLFVSHGAQTIVQLCSRAILLDSGELLLASRPKTVVGWYQRFVHATEENACKIREEIKTLNSTEMPATSNEKANDPTHGDSSPFSLAARRKARFDPGLRAQSTVEYSSRSAKIIEVNIIDAQGNIVNELLHGDRYRLNFSVSFDTAFPHVGFGMAIKTITGVEIAGQGSNNLGTGIPVEDGDIVDISFPFVNLLLPGTYFCNAGVSSHGQTTAEQLHRILDAIAFRVLPEPMDRPLSCIVNLAPSDETIIVKRRPLEHASSD